MSNAQYLASLVNSSGNINIPVSNAGINFNNSSAIGASTLTDYETGSITTPLKVGSTNNTAYYNNYSQYVKIGNIVHVNINFDTYLQTLSSTGVLSINLPFSTGTNYRANEYFNYTLNSTSTNSVAGMISLSGGLTNVPIYTDGTGATQVSAPLTSTRVTILTYFCYQANF